MILKLFSLAFKTGTAVLIMASALGWLQWLHPAFDSFSHFRLHFAALLFPILLIYLILLSFRWLIACSLTVLISIILSWPYLPGISNSNALASTGGPAVRVVQMNLRFNNSRPDLATAAIKTGKPDVILLQEVTLKTQSVMSGFKTTHPFQVSCQIQGVGSVGILSRYKFSEGKKARCARFFGYASATVTVEGQNLTLASFHSRWPWPSGQQRQIENLRGEFASLQSPLVIAGDFNAAPWSEAVRKVAKISKTNILPGFVASWAPRFLEFKTTIGPVLPIDHILLSSGISAESRTVLQDGGSDHFPVLSIIRLPQP